MKSKIPKLVFATMVSLALSSHGAALFTEDFSSNTTGPNMTAGTGFGSPTTTTTGNFTITSGESSRIYLGTNDVDYSSIDFTFRADVTAPNYLSPWSIIFLGMGSSTPVAGSYGEPLTGSNLMMALRGDEQNFGTRNNGVFGTLPPAIGLTATTHGIKMDWNVVSQSATFGYDAENDGDYTGPNDKIVSLTGSGFTSTNSQLFLGGGNGLIFDNISVTSVPEPSAALLGALCVLCLARRRRA
jgi:hypothetical protein